MTIDPLGFDASASVRLYLLFFLKDRGVVVPALGAKPEQCQSVLHCAPSPSQTANAFDTTSICAEGITPSFLSAHALGSSKHLGVGRDTYDGAIHIAVLNADNQNRARLGGHPKIK